MLGTGRVGAIKAPSVDSKSEWRDKGMSQLRKAVRAINETNAHVQEKAAVIAYAKLIGYEYKDVKDKEWFWDRYDTYIA